MRVGSDSVIGQSEHKARISSPQHAVPANRSAPPPVLSQSRSAGKARASHATGEKRNEMSVSGDHFLAAPRYCSCPGAARGRPSSGSHGVKTGRDSWGSLSGRRQVWGGETGR